MSEVLSHRGYVICHAERKDLPFLPGVEERACQLFYEHPATRDLPLINMAPGEFEHSHDAGLLWVARDGSGTPVGFAQGEVLGDAVHLEELDVDPAHGKQGLGRRLVLALCEQAATGGMDVTLTTFRGVPWNQPFYESLGFREIAGDAVTPELAGRVAEETAAGLPTVVRITMRRSRLSPPGPGTSA